MNIPFEFQIVFIAAGLISIFFLFSYLKKIEKLLFCLIDIVRELEKSTEKYTDKQPEKIQDNHIIPDSIYPCRFMDDTGYNRTCSKPDGPFKYLVCAFFRDVTQCPRHEIRPK